MTTTSHEALSEILEIARSAATAGDSARARHYFRNLTEIDPTLIDAWLGYAGCTAVLAERRALYARALECDASSTEALHGFAHADKLLATGKLLNPVDRPASAEGVVEHLPPAVPAAITGQRATPAHQSDMLGLVAVALVGLGIMGSLTAFGIFALTSFWGFMLAFLAGPAVSELVVRASRRHRRSVGGRRLQIAAGLGMILGGLGAMTLGGLLMQLVGAPLPIEAVQMAQQIGVGVDPASVLLNNPGLLVFVSSAVAATVYRMR